VRPGRRRGAMCGQLDGSWLGPVEGRGGGEARRQPPVGSLVCLIGALRGTRAGLAGPGLEAPQGGRG
jgi:hypothetical protein